MDRLKTRFNPLVPFFKIIVICFWLWMALFSIYAAFVFIFDEFTNVDQYGLALLVFVLSLPFVYIFLASFLSKTKTYLITREYIQEFNFLTFKKKRILKDQIKGFSTSSAPYRSFTSKPVIILYLRDGRKIELTRFAYFNFRKIQPFLKKMGYRYYGFEEYEWKPLNSRYYLFEKIDD